MSVPLGRRVLRLGARQILRASLRWRPLREPAPGYSIILGVPWDLRHLLPVNLKFLARTDLTGLRRLHIVFDRTDQPEGTEVIRATRERFPRLPLACHFYPGLTGRIIERIGVSTWFNSMNCVTALKAIDTQYAVLHDFDLYPLVPNYFSDVVRVMRERSLHFCGLEFTRFDGLRDDDRILGTWCLGMDVAWLRRHFRPVDVFQRVARLDTRLIQLDPFSYIQTRTSRRDLVGTLDRDDVCHVGNLVGTYVRHKSGRKPDFVWRLHYLWYLESLCGAESRLQEVISAMANASTGRLAVGGVETDFSHTHVTCANVLRDELARMEASLFGACRPEVTRYVDAFAAFLERNGATGPAELHQKVTA